MVSPFVDWTAEDVAAHNARVKGTAARLPSLPSPDEAIALKGKGAKTAAKPPTRPSKPLLDSNARMSRGKVPNKTEAAAMYALALEFPTADIRYEPMTLRMSNGHKYTPDIGLRVDYGGYILVEVKNAAFKHASYGRARLAFDQCRKEYPYFSWKWMEKTKDGWEVHDY